MKQNPVVYIFALKRNKSRSNSKWRKKIYKNSKIRVIPTSVAISAISKPWLMKKLILTVMLSVKKRFISYNLSVVCQNLSSIICYVPGLGTHLHNWKFSATLNSLNVAIWQTNTCCRPVLNVFSCQDMNSQRWKSKFYHWYRRSVTQ